MASKYELMIIARDDKFQDRIRFTLQQSALDIMSEGAAVFGHDKRVAFAARVLAGNVDNFQVAIAFLNNTTISGEASVSQNADGGYAIPDSDFGFTVNTLVNAFAGVAI